VYAYAAITTSATSVLTVAGRESSQIQILFNGRYISSGETLTWLSGVNKIAIIVKEDKYQNASYSINVTKLEE
jgi:archaellum component FlaF (FlaF/FlaG flagellin family)